MNGSDNVIQADRQAVNSYAVLYPNTYAWFVLLASLDIMLTWIVLHFGGEELNVVAQWVLARWHLIGMVVFKMSVVLLVICSCEVVGRRNAVVGRRLSGWAVAISSVPVMLGYVELLAAVYT